MKAVVLVSEIGLSSRFLKPLYYFSSVGFGYNGCSLALSKTSLNLHTL